MKKREILVTSALPYANGDLHLGYILEAIMTDVWVRFQRSQGHSVSYVCGDDAHGTGVMLKAAEQGISEEDFCAPIYQRHKQDLADFAISLDYYHTTHSPENEKRAGDIFITLDNAGLILKQSKQQLFDTEKRMFLADRFVKGTCPKCQTADQYGDNCEVCGSTYEASELINPISQFSGATPELKTVEQLYYDLPSQHAFLEQWLESDVLPRPVSNKLKEWFKDGLKPWDISREAPYFGFEIPGYPGKYFYVWMDAPIGYMASFEALCKQNPQLNFDHYWQADSTTELFHVIGKDIINFHGLFWPAILQNTGYRLPNKILVHGYVTINGEKMSKSRGTFITARQYLDHFDPDLIRYFLASKLSSNLDDVDLNLEEFAQKINADLVGKVVNIASRCAKFINKQFDNQLCTLNETNQNHYQHTIEQLAQIPSLMEQFEFSKVSRLIMTAADDANKIIDELKPWVTIKDPEQHIFTHNTCSLGINLFRAIMTCLAPITPGLATRACAFLQQDELSHQLLQTPLEQHQVAQFQPLLKRLDLKKLQQHLLTHKDFKVQESNTVPTTKKTVVESKTAEQNKAELEQAQVKPEITIEDFIGLDLRVVTIVDAQAVEGSDKMIKTTVDIGQNVTRTIFAGMKTAYQPEDMIGRKVLALVNLKPRKMRFGTSEGMLLGAGPGDKDIFLLAPDAGATTGMGVQ